MTTDQLAAVIQLRNLGYQLNEMSPQGPPVVPTGILGDVDELIAQERMRQRLNVLPREPGNRLHSVHVDRHPG